MLSLIQRKDVFRLLINSFKGYEKILKGFGFMFTDA